MTETILVVDDQPRVRTLLKDYLTSQGYRVVTANDGQDALFVARLSIQILCCWIS